jgi:hypothetical protein
MFFLSAKQDRYINKKKEKQQTKKLAESIRQMDICAKLN